MRAPFEQKIDEAAETAGSLLRSKYGLWGLGGISFIESALPAPLVTDPFLVAYILADRQAALRGLIVVTITSVIGGVFAYALAFSFYELILDSYITQYFNDEFFRIAEEFNRGTFIITILGAVTPVPYTIVALAAGFVKANLLAFIIATVIGRLFRYGIVTWLTYHYGQEALTIARQHLLVATILCFVAAAAYWFLLH